MAIVMREFEEKDIPAIHDIIIQARMDGQFKPISPENNTVEKFKLYIERMKSRPSVNYKIIVLEKDKEIIGYVDYEYVSGGRGEIKGLVIKKGERKKGYGTVLVKEAIDDMKRGGCAYIETETYSINIEFRALFGAMGFKIVSNRVQPETSKEVELWSLRLS